MSPLAVLDRGYAIARRADDGRVVRRRGDVAPGDVLSVRVADATIAATVDAVHPLGPADASRPPEPSTAGGAP